MNDELMGYKPGTVYEARVETGDKIYFKFSHGAKANYVDIMRGDISCGTWLNYLLVSDIDLHYLVPNGTWVLHTSLECNPTWLFVVSTKVKKGLAYTPVITRARDGAKVSRVVYENSLGGRHYDMIVEDDMPSRDSTPEDVKKAVEWYERQKGVYTLKSKYMKEVKKKMYLQVIEVIFFDRKTKKIVYHEHLTANDNEGAFMLAAQEFGKYDPKVHVKWAHCLFGFNEFNEEEDE